MYSREFSILLRLALPFGIITLCLFVAISRPERESLGVNSAAENSAFESGVKEERVGIEALEDRNLTAEPIRLADVASLPLLSLSELPAELHAKSAIEIEVTDGTAVRYNTDSFLLPLPDKGDVSLKVFKTVKKSDGRLVLFGRLASGERSHFSLLFEQGVLKSGSVTFFDTQDQYLVSSIEVGRLVVTLTDPDIEIPQCGCINCVQQYTYRSAL